METVGKTLHVLMTADTVGGVWTYALELARAMMPLNVRFTLVTMGQKPTFEQKAEVHALKNITLLESDFKLEWMDDPWKDVDKSGEWLLKLEEYLKPDIIHLNGYSHASIKFKNPILVAGHSCIYSWWDAVKNENPPAAYKEYFSRVKKGLASANYVVAPTYSMLNALNKHYGSFHKQSIIPNAVNPSQFKKREKAPFVFSMGRLWDEAKNISALEKISGKISWPVFIAGELKEPGRKDVQKINNACLLGNLDREEVVAQLSRAAIYALPAKYEPFGLSILEAAMSGCALVLGDIPSLRENWNGAAIFVAPDKPDELQEVLQCLINHPSQFEKLAEQAFLRAQEFLPEKMAIAYLRVYQSLIDEAELARKTKLKINENNPVLS
jgi:glycogen synthase